jgi:hypothetical protein
MDLFETIKKQLKDFVEVKRVDSIVTHFRQIFLFANEDKICGSFTLNEIKVWVSSQ